MNRAAQKLGRLGKGKPKNFSKAELKRRSERMTELNQKRSLNGKVKGNAQDRRKARRAA